jgi:2-haloacid dehalogenase
MEASRAMTIHVFDAYGTLLDVHAAVRRLADRIGPVAEPLNRTMRTKQLEYTWVRTLGGFPWRDFRELTGQAFDYALAVHGRPADPALREEMLALYDRLDPYPDAVSALERLAERGERLAVLSNGTKAMLRAAFEAAGLAERFEAMLSVDDVTRYKTCPTVYQFACERLRVRPDEIAFYSSNRWDAAAATLAGYAATWVNRTEAPDEYPDLAPKRVVRSLAEIV